MSAAGILMATAAVEACFLGDILLDTLHCFRPKFGGDFWREWRGSSENRITFWSRDLFDTKLLRIQVHKFVGDDLPEQFHTHPAWAIRIGLRGGYIEEIHHAGGLPIYRAFRAGDIGIVRHSTCHRLHALLDDSYAYTLWIRGPVVAKAKLVGKGWKRK